MHPVHSGRVPPVRCWGSRRRYSDFFSVRLTLPAWLANSCGAPLSICSCLLGKNSACGIGVLESQRQPKAIRQACRLRSVAGGQRPGQTFGSGLEQLVRRVIDARGAGNSDRRFEVRALRKADIVADQPAQLAAHGNRAGIHRRRNLQRGEQHCRALVPEVRARGRGQPHGRRPLQSPRLSPLREAATAFAAARPSHRDSASKCAIHCRHDLNPDIHLGTRCGRRLLDHQ